MYKYNDDADAREQQRRRFIFRKFLFEEDHTEYAYHQRLDIVTDAALDDVVGIDRPDERAPVYRYHNTGEKVHDSRAPVFQRAEYPLPRI